MKKVLQILSFNLTFIFSMACGNDALEVSDDPSNLSLEVVFVEEAPNEIAVIAVAENTVEYEFYSGVSGNDPVVNVTGEFNHTYVRTGIYTIEIRAYGSNERFLKRTKQVIIESVENPVDPEDGYITPPTYDGMTLVWSDEFDGNALNTADWTYEIGTGSNGWGNNELQYYREENTTVSDGILTIEAKEESFGGSNYTSSRLITKDKQEFQYGRVDIRALLPKGQGLWPALWMLGENINTVSWPACGEIDIMEMIGGTNNDNTVHGTIHWDNNGSYAKYGGSKRLSEGILADEYHVYSIIWDESKITWYMDDLQYNVVDVTPSELSEFHNDFFFIFNVAVGGNWPGNPNSSTVFPQKMKVDYIRVFQPN